MKRIFQFADRRFSPDSGLDTRWIAASTEEAANERAKKCKWEPCGGEILKGHSLATDTDLCSAGVDVVLP